MKSFIYIPSFDSAVSQMAGKKGLTLADGTPWRFWYDTFPKFYQHKYYLVSAGHNYKKDQHSVEYDFPDDMFILGDSGGYQLATGVLKWDEKLLPKILTWLENNSTVSINLDLPPRGAYAGKFQEALDLSVSNFTYFQENRTGKSLFLNVLHGSTYDKYNHWYKSVNVFDFDGWACGGSIGKLTAQMDWLTVLLENGEFMKKNVKYVHMLGASSVLDFLVLAQIQRSLVEIGSNTTITTDSSTPSRATAYGMYYIGSSWKNLTFQNVVLPKSKNLQSQVINHLPILNEVDKRIYETYPINEFLQFKSEHYAWMVLHNYCVFFDVYKQANDYIWSDDSILQQVVSRDTYQLLRIIDEMIKSSNPRQYYLTKLPLIEKMSRMAVTSNIEQTTDFF